MVLYVELPQPPSGWLLRTTSGHCSVDFFFSFFHSGQFNVENAQQCCLQQTVSKLQYPLLFAFALVTTSHINLARDTFGRQFEPYPLWCLGHCSQTVVVIKLLQTSAFKIQCKGCTMHYLILDPSQWLVWHVVLIKHCFNNCKRKQNDSSSVDQQLRQKRKARASLPLKRLIQSSDSTYCRTQIDKIQHTLTEQNLGSDLECHTQSFLQLFTCSQQRTAGILSVLLISMASHPISSHSSKDHVCAVYFRQRYWSRYSFNACSHFNRDSF